jgi:hypothetical protein
MHGAYRCGATYGLTRGLSAWRADRRVFGRERLHDGRDRKEDAKQHKRRPRFVRYGCV